MILDKMLSSKSESELLVGGSSVAYKLLLLLAQEGRTNALLSGCRGWRNADANVHMDEKDAKAPSVATEYLMVVVLPSDRLIDSNCNLEIGDRIRCYCIGKRLPMPSSVVNSFRWKCVPDRDYLRNPR